MVLLCARVRVRVRVEGRIIDKDAWKTRRRDMRAHTERRLKGCIDAVIPRCLEQGHAFGQHAVLLHQRRNVHRPVLGTGCTRNTPGVSAGVPGVCGGAGGGG